MAVSDLAPAVVSVIAHCPAATVPVHELAPSLTVTLPDGVPPPGATAATLYCTTTGCPVTEGSGVSELIVALVVAWFTWCVTLAEAGLGAKVASPA